MKRHTFIPGPNPRKCKMCGGVRGNGIAHVFAASAGTDAIPWGRQGLTPPAHDVEEDPERVSMTKRIAENWPRNS